MRPGRDGSTKMLLDVFAGWLGWCLVGSFRTPFARQLCVLQVPVQRICVERHGTETEFTIADMYVSRPEKHEEEEEDVRAARREAMMLV